MFDALKLYHSMPYPFRVMVASAHGYYLQYLRYGKETEELAAQAKEREYWSESKRKSWQEERLSYILERAATRVPYYRDYWSKKRGAGDRASWQYLENWPVLEKEPLRENPTGFVAEDCDKRWLIHEHTSGTTGKSLDLWFSRDTARAYYALFERRWRHWNGVSRRDRWANVGGQLITPFAQKKPPFWVWNQGFHQLYMSSYHLAPSNIGYYLDALITHKIKYLWGYTSSLYQIALEATRQGRSDLKLALVLTNAEPLYEYQREVIAEAFQCPVRETYGLSEMVISASECQFGRLHIWPEVGHLEMHNQPKHEPIENSGELISTGLLNHDMPLIRYRVGDRIRLDSKETLCACGRTLPMLESVEGRVDDVLYTRDGRAIGRLDTVFKTNLGVREAQIVQDSLDRVTIRFVPAPEFDSAAARSLTERLQDRMGDIKVILEPTNEIPRGKNGKFRAVICNIPKEERRVSA